jgi:hypothetical protein
MSAAGGSVDPPVLISNFDAGNPLHIQTNDNSGTALIPFKLLGTENYRIWSGAMKLALQARNKFSFVDGSCLKETYVTSDVLYAQWDRCNAIVLTWLMNSVSQDVYMGLVYSDNAACVWKELQETYDKVDGSVIYNLLQKINCVKQGGTSVVDYYHRLNSLWREFDVLTKLPVCVCEVKCSCDDSKELGMHKQLMKLMQFLMGLDDWYQPVRTALLTRDPLPEVKDAYITVSREESHRGIPESSSVTESKLNASSFAAKSFNNNRRMFNNNNNNTRGINANTGTNSNTINRGPNPNLNCKNCGKIGHTIDRCYEIIGFPPGFVKNNNNATKQNGFRQNYNANTDMKQFDNKNSPSVSTSSGFTSEQMKKLLSLINDSPSGSIHANMAGRASFFNGNVWFNINFFRFFCSNSNITVKTLSLGWIIDSGANQHLTVSIVGMFNVIDISSLRITVGHPNGTLATISHVGNLKLTNNVTLYDVLVVPGYCVSLLSVNKLIRDSKMFVGFDEDTCYIQDLKKENTLGTGSQSDGLYLFDMQSNNNVSKCNMIMSYNVSKLVWHNRLGHPADPVLSVLQNDLGISKNISVLVCEICHRAKQTREPFPLSEHKSENIGDLVHLDLWGPYRVTSREGYKYFLTIVDDHSRVVWVYLIKSKDEVFGVFCSFIHLISTQFGDKIKVVRSDNGTEFVNRKMNDMFSDLGIIHQTSCAHTPQQNGIAERKHRHLLCKTLKITISNFGINLKILKLYDTFIFFKRNG